MEPSTQFCIGLHNEPGALAKLCGRLHDAGVCIDALFVSDDEDGCWVNMVASPTDRADHTLESSGYSFFTETVLTLWGKNQPGVLARVASRLAQKHVNINYVYGAGGEAASFMLVLSVDDIELAQKTLQHELDAV